MFFFVCGKIWQLKVNFPHGVIKWDHLWNYIWIWVFCITVIVIVNVRQKQASEGLIKITYRIKKIIITHICINVASNNRRPVRRLCLAVCWTENSGRGIRHEYSRTLMKAVHLASVLKRQNFNLNISTYAFMSVQSSVNKPF